jgi:hypothetical protein
MGFTPPQKQPDFATLKATLAQIKEKDNALYRTIKSIIDLLMRFQGITVQELGDINNSINSISSVVNLVPTIKERTFLTELDETLYLPHARRLLAGTNISFDDSVDGERTVNAILTALSTLDFLTHSDESIALPNSRQLIAGANITFYDTVANQRTISAAGGGASTHYDAPLTDGDVDATDFIFANGECIIVQVPI